MVSVLCLQGELKLVAGRLSDHKPTAFSHTMARILQVYLKFHDYCSPAVVTGKNQQKITLHSCRTEFLFPFAENQKLAPEQSRQTSRITCTKDHHSRVPEQGSQTVRPEYKHQSL
ncbi:uncharacterized protein LOC135148450 [Daucus carota subsp. sativus]|uniref:uncharacterized protein LOC135148450 n=1 Tax=Daucus carota subsp. sativus TaxID=79200 RepID=UPI0030828EB6